jgi:threonine dehydratase
MPRTISVPDADQLARAAAVVEATLAPTPLVPAPALGTGVWLKLETLQPTGSFKVRGGLAAVSAAVAQDPSAPIVAASAGNHGLGVAFAAERLGARATVVVPTGASEAKVGALARFDVELVREGDSYEAAEAHALDLAERRGGRFVSPYNDPDVIAGQATVVTELLAARAAPAQLVVPVGGGGLLAGLGLGLERAGADTRLIGVEPERSRAMAAAVAAGHTVAVEVGSTLADGLAGNLEPGTVTVPLAARLAHALVAVSEAEIEAAVVALVTGQGLVAEGAGAVGVAALRAGLVPPDGAGRDTVILVTGRNIARAVLAGLLARAEG